MVDVDRDCHKADIQSAHQQQFFDPGLSAEQDCGSASSNLGHFPSGEYSATQGAYDGRPAVAQTISLPIAMAAMALMNYAMMLARHQQLGGKAVERIGAWINTVQRYAMRSRMTSTEAASAEKEVEGTFAAFKKLYESKHPQLVEMFDKVCDGVRESIKHARQIGEIAEQSAETIGKYGPRKL